MKALFLALAATAALALPAQAEDVTVAVTAIVEHPALDAARDGVKDALAAAGYKEGEGLKFVYQSAQGNPATAAQIARQFVGDAPNVIVPISTPSAQAVVSATKDIPVVFTAVSDPLGAQLVKDMDKPGGNVTGLSDMSPVAAHIELIKEILPQVKTIGYLYNSGEANSVSLLAALKEAAGPAGITVVESAATKTAEVQGAARALVGRVDAIYVPTDNTTNNGLMAPLGVYAADGKTLVYAYAGDMQGNIWKFDLRSSTPSAWSATRIFHAEKTSGTPQPITGGLASAIDLKTNKRWIFFGTGRFMTSTDADDKTTYAQSMYGVMDDGGSYTRANLTARSITVAGDYRYFEDKAALPSASKGWYVDLPGKGERIVQDVQIDNDYMVAASMIPEGDACDASGSGFLNAIDAFTGTSGGKSYFDLDMSGSTDDTGAGGHPIGSVNLGVGMPTRPVLLPGVGVVDGSAGVGASSFGKQMMTWQRVSWREIRND